MTMQCSDCGQLRHPGTSCIDYELDVWFFQTEASDDDRCDYGEWIFDNHCFLSDFLRDNDLEPEELAYIMTQCVAELGFMLGGGAMALHYIQPKRPTIQ